MTQSVQPPTIHSGRTPASALYDLACTLPRCLTCPSRNLKSIGPVASTASPLPLPSNQNHWTRTPIGRTHTKVIRSCSQTDKRPKQPATHHPEQHGSPPEKTVSCLDLFLHIRIVFM